MKNIFTYINTHTEIQNILFKSLMNNQKKFKRAKIMYFTYCIRSENVETNFKHKDRSKKNCIDTNKNFPNGCDLVPMNVNNIVLLLT